MRILVVDGQGGRLGRMTVEQLKERLPSAEVTAVGTNSIATAAMLKGGADAAATGENPVVVCAAKEILYWYTIRAAKKLDSLALKASAWDHRSDVFAALGVFAGILGARLGLPILDAVASVVISILILRVAVNIFIEAVNQTVDRACEPELEGRFRTAALSQGGVRRIDEMRSRRACLITVHSF